MNNLYNYRRRFNSSLESTLGNVKPLVSEATEPPVGDEPGEGKVEVTPQDKENVRSFLYDKIMEVPEIHTDLGISSHDSKETVLDKLSHKVHVHLDKDHLSFELPGLGANKKFIPTLGLGLTSHKSSHGDGHDNHGATPSYSTLEVPHSFFDVGFKIDLNGFLNKNKNHSSH